ncbi:GerAB/ArcD/ProY family transporter [Paenibacillus cymbidii]|uniref:GerAB/ArcD/ProY family transporter n=1 Tax=Paenibacillus cymbidii TaxID=1639034 RepID=UPI0010809ADF|nr:endospore germination permease [Paenibacillus cymbidii]
MTKLRITNGMYVAMIVNFIYAKAIGVTQGVLAMVIGQDMWIATLFGTVQGAVMIYITYLAIRHTPERDFIGLGAALLGQWFGKLVALVIFLFFLAAFGPLMITFVYHLQEYFLPEAPIMLFIVSALIVGAVGCFYGLEVMARISLIGVLCIVLLNVLIVLGSMNEFDIRNLLPVMELGFIPTVVASVHYNEDWALATMMAALVLPHVKDVQKRGGQLGVAGIMLSGLLVGIWAILEAAVLSSEVTSKYTVSCMKLARNAHIGIFLQRYEMIMIALYSLPILFGVMFCLYGASFSLSKLLGVRSYRKLIAPACLPVGAFGYWIVEDHFRAIYYLEHYWPRIANPVAFGLPLLMLLLRFVFGKKLSQAS